MAKLSNSSNIGEKNKTLTLWEVSNEYSNNTDMNFYHCGEQKCKGGHSYGPAVRDHFLIHYIVSGRGFYRCGKNTYTLTAGNGFLICPDYLTYYEADETDPWHYYWVGFNGASCSKILNYVGLSQLSPIFFSEDSQFFVNIIENMSGANEFPLEKELYRLSCLYMFLSKLAKLAPPIAKTGAYSIIDKYITSSIDYVEKNYHYEISVNSLSDYIGINRKYLYTIFKEKLGITPIEYIIKTRMKKACILLSKEELTLTYIALSVGYKDQFTFSKQFKKTLGMSPSIYRMNLLNNK